MRNLALRAADAAKNTATLIEGTVVKVKEGTQFVERTNNEFQVVAQSVAKSGNLVAEIAEATHEQAQGISQINKALSEVDQVTQQNAANAEESASASQDMNSQAEQTRASITNMLTLVGNMNAITERHLMLEHHHSAGDC